MSRTSIFEKRWLDLVFEGKNKSYGAYQLRLESRRTNILALFYGLLFVGGLSGGGFLLSSFGEVPPVVDMPATDDGIVVVAPYFPKTDNPAPELPPTKTETPPATTDKSDWRKDPQVSRTDDTTVNPTTDSKPPVTAQPESGNGGPTIENGGSGSGTTGTGTGAGTIPDDKPVITGSLDKQPKYPGGIEEFYKKIANEFEKPTMTENANIRIIVTFVVEKDGSMTDVKVIGRTAESLEREALRVMKSFKKKWEPGIKNGKAVRTLFTLPIVLQPNDQY